MIVADQNLINEVWWASSLSPYEPERFSDRSVHEPPFPDTKKHLRASQSVIMHLMLYEVGFAI